MRRFGRAVGMIAACSGLALVAACGGQGSAGPSASGDGSESPVVAEAKAATEATFKQEGFTAPSQDTPAPAVGKKVTVVTYGLAAPTGADFADGAAKAGEALGWDVSVFDGQFSSQKYLDGIRQAIAEKSDAVVLYLIDCAQVKTGLEEAHAAGLLVVATESADCDLDGGPKLFDGEVTWKEGNFLEWVRGLAKVQADYTIAKTNGEANVILFKETDLFIAAEQADAYTAEMKKCEGCKIVQEIPFVAADFGPNLQAKAEQALLNNPTANAVVVPYDDLMTSGVAAAVFGSGRNDDVLSIGGTGYAPNLDLVRENRGQDAGYGISVNWEGWASMDVLNRLFAGQEPVMSGMSIGFWDADHMPASGGWKPDVDYATAYKTAWANAAASSK